MDAFDTLELYKFDETKLFRASDTERRGWNTYGAGPVRIHIIKRSDHDYQGWGMMTFHNRLSRACGLNVLIVPNFAMEQSVNEPERVTFKALSRTFGSNGKKNMYSLKLASAEDAARLWYVVFVLQLAAKQTRRTGYRITIPSPVSVEATVLRAFIGTDQDEVDRHLVRSRLCQLATSNQSAFSSQHHVWATTFFAAPIPRNGGQDLYHDVDDAQSVDGSYVPENESFVAEVADDDNSVGTLAAAGEEYSVEAPAEDEHSAYVAITTQVTRDEDDEQVDNGDGDETSSLGSYSDFVESQDWFASFTPHKK